MCFGSGSPAACTVLPEEFDERLADNADQCIIDGEHYFVSDHIELPMAASDEIFIWPVWVSVSEVSFEHMNEYWETKGREKCEPYFG